MCASAHLISKVRTYFFPKFYEFWKMNELFKEFSAMSVAQLSPIKTPVVKLKPKAVSEQVTKIGSESASGTSSVEDRYKKKEHREHILLRPDTYIGAIEHEEISTWIYDTANEKMVKSDLTFCAGLYKIFDEILVNAIDQYTRMRKYLEIQEALRAGKKTGDTCGVSLDQVYRPVKSISVVIDLERNQISVENDGSGIEVAMHSKEGVYVPELIFGHLLSGENFEDSEKGLAQDKTWGGRNGYGAKLTNIFSSRFEIETVDEVRKLHYHQVFRNSMSIIEPPMVTKYTKVPFTKVTFTPDLGLFNIRQGRIDTGTAAIMTRRVIDTAGWTDASVKVVLNGTPVPVRSFERYTELYIGPKAGSDNKRVFYSSPDGRWEICVCVAPDQKFEQVSFVNGIATLRGGKHVDYIVNQITRKMLAQFATAKNSTLKAQHIKDNIWIFIKAVVPDPTFDTQTKESLSLAITKISAKSRCDLPDEFIAKVAKCGVLERAKQLNVFKDRLDLAKTDGEKKTRCKVPKLIDAYWAGGPKSEQCVLVVTEGDSASTWAEAGIATLPADGQRFWGVFPLRGKPLNVREATARQIATNAEILALKQILGLQQNADYSKSKSSLRYGRMIILSDADLDGYHIRGLIINFLHFFWPSLLRRGDFLQAMMTPIVRAWKYHRGARTVQRQIDQSTVLNFWTEAEFRQWSAEASKSADWNQWEIKYYKGLGTSNDKIAEEIFRMRQVVEYQCSVPVVPNQSQSPEPTPEKVPETDQESGDDILPTTAGAAAPAVVGKTVDDQIIELAFDKTYADQRKLWLAEHQPDLLIPFKQRQTLTEFVNEELRQFSVADCIRSIPSICDGLKPSQRKILYLLIRDNINKEIKVAHFAGFVAAKTDYHHGEASLFGAIIKMAQNYVGANNINLLYPEGQFGSRRQNGKDCASARYINTFKTPIVDALFPRADNDLYDYLDVDGMRVEPRWYLPVVPMILVNGAEGIGTGFSCDVAGYNPRDVVANLRRMLAGGMAEPMTPWVRGFGGTIVPNPKKVGSFLMRGAWRQTGEDQIEISEIPTNHSYESYREFLDGLTEKEAKTDSTGKRETPARRTDRIVREVIKSIDTSFRPFRPVIQFVKGGLAQLGGIDDGPTVISAFKLESVINTSNMHLFNSNGKIQKYGSAVEILTDYFPVRLEFYRRRLAHQLKELEHELAMTSARFRFVSEVMDEKIAVYRQRREAVVEQLTAGDYPKSDGEYNYLLHMRIESFTEETLKRLEKEIADCQAKIEWLRGQTPESFWLADLDAFEKAYSDFEADWEIAHKNSEAAKTEAVKAPKRRVIKKL
jgi:DNA topoisomerase II